MLKFIEERFGLGRLTARDHFANDLRDMFDFQQPPNPPYVIPLPLKIQWRSLPYPGSYRPLVPIGSILLRRH
jgi:hypothetical protein